jgi:hypothetical protein
MLAGLDAPPDLVARARGAHTANEVLGLAKEAGLPLADAVAQAARAEAARILGNEDIAVGVLVVDRGGVIVGECGVTPTLPVGIPPLKGEGPMGHRRARLRPSPLRGGWRQPGGGKPGHKT